MATAAVSTAVAAPAAVAGLLRTVCLAAAVTRRHAFTGDVGDVPALVEALTAAADALAGPTDPVPPFATSLARLREHPTERGAVAKAATIALTDAVDLADARGIDLFGEA